MRSMRPCIVFILNTPPFALFFICVWLNLFVSVSSHSHTVVDHEKSRFSSFSNSMVKLNIRGIYYAHRINTVYMQLINKQKSFTA